MVEGEFGAGINFEFLHDNHEDCFILLLEGGTRSGKTFDVIIFLCWYLNTYTGKKITVGRDWLSDLKDTLLVDWDNDITPYFNMPRTRSPQKPFLEYNGNIVKFRGVNDNIMASHGRKQDVLWLNEAMNIEEATFNQMKQRTTDLIIIDYNPSAVDHWIYKLEERPDTKLIKTTILTNSFAPKQNRIEVAGYEPWESGTYEVVNNECLFNGQPITDKNQPPPHTQNCKQGSADIFMWKVYGLGIRAQSEETVYKDWRTFDPDSEEYKEIKEKGAYDLRVIGVDFGYANSKAAAVECIINGNNLYLTELHYKTGTDNQELAEILIPHLDGGTYVVCDNAEPKSLAELYKHGVVGAIKCEKEKGAHWGIQVVKQYRIHVNKNSLNLQEEFYKYRYKKDKATGVILNEVVKTNDDLMDAMRYGVTKFNQQLI